MSPPLEALSRLAAEGFVLAESQRGFRVAPVSRDDLFDLAERRIELETNVLARSIERGGHKCTGFEWPKIRGVGFIVNCAIVYRFL